MDKVGTERPGWSDLQLSSANSIKPGESNQSIDVRENQIVASVVDVSKHYGKNKALDKVSLNVHCGEVLSVLGPNGAGKTTLINILLGRLSAEHGTVSVMGNLPGELRTKRRCGAMLQVSGLPDMLTVKEHIELFQSYYVSPIAYTKVIDLAGLEEIQNRYSKNLSGGQKQRLLFALAICGNPDLLFLDEPSVGMDITARKSLWSAIAQLKNQGTSIILTTHYLEEADQLSDRVMMLNKGSIIQQGTPEEIKSRMRFKKISFTSEVPIQKLLSLSAIERVELAGNLYEIQTDKPVKALKQLFEMTDDISNLTVTGAALEDAFIQLNRSHETKSEESSDTSEVAN
ncbi:ABC transporter ATP-binding protein [Aliikangiella coralliicola]|uniref:ABC transporter ATP-binding protein n=2 Tax=Aliikangiella coralliicola TaxID=2592383 RepID=A0A545UEU3_9GAMM|nr:ABC transporter ATP-binding protein [Aliikangiella coralliicola]